MSKLFFIILSTLLWVACSSTELNDEVLGLIVFKSGLLDPHNSLVSWNEEDEYPCSWRFIECGAVNRRVLAVSLNGLGLSGKLGRGLEKLQFLKMLSLSGNSLSGTINSELLLLPKLERLNLSNNAFSGMLPSSFTSFLNLQFLDLSMNSLSGPLPDNLFANCSSLRHLSLARNSLEGAIPSTLTRCTVLNHLNFSSNHFSRELIFFNGIWTLTRIRTLDLSSNKLSGSIPEGISALYSLKVLDLHENQLTGSVPQDIGLCTHLNQIDLSNNLLNGTVPDSLQTLKTLEFLSLSNNALTGDLPQWITQMPALKYIDFSNNILTGSLPSYIGAMKFLKFLSLSNNKLTGEIPSSLIDCTSLSVLQLSQNSINGSIPEALFSKSFERLDLSRNKLMGLIPSASSKLSDALQVLDLSDNNLSGKIPAEMGILNKLRYLNLSYNQLESSIPPELGYFPNLTVLDFRGNRLMGSIPGDICESGSLKILQLDGNSLAGSIPDEIGNCSSLFLLSLSHNNITGPIPESLSQLSELKVLRLEVNQLTGEIPKHLTNLENLLIANVSNNLLIGRLPPGGIFQTLDASSIDGNRGICSPLLKEPCMLNVPKPLVLDPYTFVGNGIESNFSNSTRSVDISPGRLIFFDSKLSLDLLNTTLEAVLSKSAEIGEGVFGTVYKASVGGQGTIVAIKKLITAHTLHFQEEFDREIRVLAKARHSNLNPLRGYYWTPQLQLLVSEYSTGGNLQTKLHDSLLLSWANRFKIIVGTAKGLAYLHHSFQPPIIHFNIKPSNILLDQDLNPKISDFGLARLLANFDKHVASFQSAPGYIAPELTCQSPDEEVLPLIKLALVCTSQVPSSRPSMAEVVQILEVIKAPLPDRKEVL